MIDLEVCLITDWLDGFEMQMQGETVRDNNVYNEKKDDLIPLIY